MKKYISTKILSVFVLLFGATSYAQQYTPQNVEQGQLMDSMAQTAGEFEHTKLNYIHSLGMQQKAWNDPLAHMGEGQTKPGYSKYLWTPDTVLPIRVREGMVTLINLPTWELIEKVHIGSPESFAGEIPAPNSLLIYADPSFIGADCNMIIFGRSGNRYAFYLRSETYNTSKITQSVVDVLVGPRYTPVSAGGKLVNGGGVSTMASAPTTTGKNAPMWAGGSGQNPQVGLNTASTGPANWLENIPVDPEKFKFDVEMYIPNPADVDIAPERVWHDEIFTYIDFGKKALTMTQRPVVNLVVQESEVPVGFRTRGKYSRLLVVEAVGDLVLRNGKKVICLKLRRDPAMGLEYTDYSTPSAATNIVPTKQANYAQPYGMEQVAYPIPTEQKIPEEVLYSQQATANMVNMVNDISMYKTNAKGLQKTESLMPEENIALELGNDTDIMALEKKWENISSQNGDVLMGFEPYYSVDATADGEVRELFRLRVGPVKDVQSGDVLCRKLAKKGVTCSVVRVQ